MVDAAPSSVEIEPRRQFKLRHADLGEEVNLPVSVAPGGRMVPPHGPIVMSQSDRRTTAVILEGRPPIGTIIFVKCGENGNYTYLVSDPKRSVPKPDPAAVYVRFLSEEEVKDLTGKEDHPTITINLGSESNEIPPAGGQTG